MKFRWEDVILGGGVCPTDFTFQLIATFDDTPNVPSNIQWIDDDYLLITSDESDTVDFTVLAFDSGTPSLTSSSTFSLDAGTTMRDYSFGTVKGWTAGKLLVTHCTYPAHWDWYRFIARQWNGSSFITPDLNPLASESNLSAGEVEHKSIGLTTNGHIISMEGLVSGTLMWSVFSFAVKGVLTSQEIDDLPEYTSGNSYVWGDLVKILYVGGSITVVYQVKSTHTATSSSWQAQWLLQLDETKSVWERCDYTPVTSLVSSDGGEYVDNFIEIQGNEFLIPEVVNLTTSVNGGTLAIGSVDASGNISIDATGDINPNSTGTVKSLNNGAAWHKDGEFIAVQNAQYWNAGVTPGTTGMFFLCKRDGATITLVDTLDSITELGDEAYGQYLGVTTAGVWMNDHLVLGCGDAGNIPRVLKLDKEAETLTVVSTGNTDLPNSQISFYRNSAITPSNNGYLAIPGHNANTEVAVYYCPEFAQCNGY